jgi:hypothetical protein
MGFQSLAGGLLEIDEGFVKFLAETYLSIGEDLSREGEPNADLTLHKAVTADPSSEFVFSICRFEKDGSSFNLRHEVQQSNISRI